MSNIVLETSIRFLEKLDDRFRSVTFRDAIEDMDPVHVLKEFLTLTLNCGRQAGHTSAALNLSFMDRSLVIHRNRRLWNKENIKNKVHFFNNQNQSWCHDVPENTKLVIVDQAKDFDIESIEFIENFFANYIVNKNKHFALLLLG